MENLFQGASALPMGRSLPAHPEPDFLYAIPLLTEIPYRNRQPYQQTGVSALQLGHDLDVQYKTSFVLPHKLHEVIAGKDVGSLQVINAAKFTSSEIPSIARPTSGYVTFGLY